MYAQEKTTRKAWDDLMAPTVEDLNKGVESVSTLKDKAETEQQAVTSALAKMSTEEQEALQNVLSSEGTERWDDEVEKVSTEAQAKLDLALNKTEVAANVTAVAAKDAAKWVTAAKGMRDADHEMHEKGLKYGHELEIMSRNKADLDAFIAARANAMKAKLERSAASQRTNLQVKFALKTDKASVADRYAANISVADANAALKAQGIKLAQVAAAKRSAELPGVPAPTPRAWSFTEIYDAVKHTAERNFLPIRGTGHSPTVNETAEMHGTTGIGKRYYCLKNADRRVVGQYVEDTNDENRNNTMTQKQCQAKYTNCVLKEQCNGKMYYADGKLQSDCCAKKYDCKKLVADTFDGVPRYLHCNNNHISIHRVPGGDTKEWRVSFGHPSFYTLASNADLPPTNTTWFYNTYTTVSRDFGTPSLEAGQCAGCVGCSCGAPTLASDEKVKEALQEEQPSFKQESTATPASGALTTSENVFAQAMKAFDVIKLTHSPNALDLADDTPEDGDLKLAEAKAAEARISALKEREDASVRSVKAQLDQMKDRVESIDAANSTDNNYQNEYSEYTALWKPPLDAVETSNKAREAWDALALERSKLMSLRKSYETMNSSKTAVIHKIAYNLGKAEQAKKILNDDIEEIQKNITSK